MAVDPRILDGSERHAKFTSGVRTFRYRSQFNQPPVVCAGRGLDVDLLDIIIRVGPHFDRVRACPEAGLALPSAQIKVVSVRMRVSCKGNTRNSPMPWAYCDGGVLVLLYIGMGHVGA